MFEFFIFYKKTVSPTESRENLRSPQSPNDPTTTDTSRRASSEHEIMNPHSSHSTTESFKDMFSQKKNMLLNKLASFESDVSLVV